MDAFKEILTKERISETQRVSTIRIIYKKRDPTEMKNYRPISLLNVDVTIITRTSTGLRTAKQRENSIKAKKNYTNNKKFRAQIKDQN